MRAKLLLAIFWTLQVLGNIATALLFRAEEPLRTLCLISLGITLVSLVGILIGVVAGWKSPLAPMTRLSTVLAFCLIGLTNSQTANLHHYYFRRDLPALQKTVDELLATGQSESWKGVAHAIRVVPQVGKPQFIYFTVRRGNSPMCYEWHAKEHPAPTKSGKKIGVLDKSHWHYFWMGAHWREDIWE